MNHVGNTTSLNIETVPSIKKKQKQKAHKEISMIIKIVVDFSTSMCVLKMSLYVDVAASSHLQRKTIVGSKIMFFFVH